MSLDSGPDFLRRARIALPDIDLSGYAAYPVEGAFQSKVWRLRPRTGDGDLVLRQTPKPYELICRIGRIVDSVTTVACARTLAAAPLPEGGTTTRNGTIHLATWLPETAPRDRVSMRDLGTTMARLHAELDTQPEPLADRPLTFDLVDTADAWSRARQLWVRGRRAWPLINGPAAERRLIHGDTHSGNYLITTDGQIGLIDFDKMMRANPVFDLAKIVDSALFRYVPTTFDTVGACDLLESYYAPDPVAESSVTALEGLAVLINECVGIIGGTGRRGGEADATGCWWLQRAGDPDPLGIRAALARRGSLSTD